MKDVTLVAIEWQWYDLTRYAIERSLEHIDAKEVVIISDKEILSGAKHIIMPPVNGMSEYANIMLKGTNEHVNTGHALYVQWDGIANDKTQWTDDFLKYDYIGAPWPWEPEGKNIGNGGFSLRSKKLLEACQDHVIALTDNIAVAEDKIIGSVHRTYLEQQGIQFAPTALAKQFSFELGDHVPSFGFHGLWNIFNLMTDADMDYFYTRINYQGWNVFKWHHTLAAVQRRNRMDIFEYMIAQLIENNPEMLDQLAKWLEFDSTQDTTKLVIR
jgi:hypothetical protein